MSGKCEYTKSCRGDDVTVEPISTEDLTLRKVCEKHTEGRIGALEFHEYPNACKHILLRGPRKGEPCSRWRSMCTDPSTYFQHTKGAFGVKTFHRYPNACEYVVARGPG